MKVIFLMVGLFTGNLLFAQTDVVVDVTNLRSDNGQIIVSFFEDEEAFEDEEPSMNKVFNKSSVRDGKMQLKFTVPSGSYGLSFVDDENGNDELDYNFIGMPTEGFGFSDHYHTGMSKPALSQFKISVKSGKTNKVRCKIRYM